MDQDSGKGENTRLGTDDAKGLHIPASLVCPLYNPHERSVLDDRKHISEGGLKEYMKVCVHH